MTAYKLKKVLEHIADYAYPGEKLERFYVEYVVKECTTVNANYHITKKKIIIFNFSRPTTNIMCTAIHELAHHVCYTRTENKNHDIDFYRVFKELLSAAVELGYVNYEDCRKIDDSRTVHVMEKKLGKIQASYNSNNDPNKEFCTIQVVGGYSIKEYLSEKRFHYSPLERIWEKDIKRVYSDRYINDIQKLDSNIQVIISDITDLSIQVYYIITVKKNTYQHRKVLSEHKYWYDNGTWHKKVSASDFFEEYLFLKKLNGIEFKIM